MGKLVVSLDNVVIKEFQITKERTTLGRRPYNDIVIDNLAVSGEHAVLTAAQSDVYIEDLNSTNGIYVKSKRVRRHYLNDGDVVLIGKHELIYIDERLPRARAPYVETVPGVGPPGEPLGEPN